MGLHFGIILAAGLGRRLSKTEPEGTAKPLVRVDNLSILSRTIRFHRIVGCRRVIIVVGWQAERIESQIRAQHNEGIEIEFVTNPRFDLQNGVSVLCARERVKGAYLLTMADHLLDDRMAVPVGRHRPRSDGAALCVDYKVGTIFDMDDATKVLAEEGRVRRIGKTLDTYNCIDTGVFVGTGGLMDVLGEVYEETGDASLSQGVARLAERGKMAALDIGDCYWQDIDTPETLDHAETLLRTALSESSRGEVKRSGTRGRR